MKAIYFMGWLLTVYLIAWFRAISGYWSLFIHWTDVFECHQAQAPCRHWRDNDESSIALSSEFTSSENCELIFAIECWPKTNRLSDISPAKMGLFRISRELQFGLCNHGKPRASSRLSREGECFYRGEKEVGRVIKNKESTAFHWLSPCQERGGAFLFLIVLSYHHRTRELPVPVSQLFNWAFCLLIFTRVMSKTPMDMHPRVGTCPFVVGRCQESFREGSPRRILALHASRKFGVAGWIQDVYFKAWWAR